MATAIPVDPGLQSAKTLKLENTHNRDVLIAIEKKYQKQWQDSKVFEHDAPSTSEIPFDSEPAAAIREKYPKYFGTFAFPYMNGSLHAGHSFTVSKVEFTAGFARLQGKRALFPLGFHCTGMPIKACADKLVEDVRRFGKNFENYHEDQEEPANGVPIAPTQGVVKEDITKFKSKKGKQAAKSVKTNYQFQTMLTMGIPREEIHKFSDAAYWLDYFPPIAKDDLVDFGARIDWRRQFVTTDANPYFDAFVRWQMNRLHELNKILYGRRYTIYSPKDGQPCMDHDRTKGEGVGPTEYTALKLQVKEWSPKAAEAISGKVPKDAKVYFVPATLRPETMYGQVCCFVGPTIRYGVFKASEDEYYVCTKRAAWNMCFQGKFFPDDESKFPRAQDQLLPVVELPGSDFVGTLVNAPLSVHTEGVRILPMESVSATKGTGVVTSVPSDSPDDYATMRELAKKAEYYGIRKEWADLEIIPLIDTPAYGNLIAKTLVEKMKIQSPKDATALAEAKDLAYKEGFYNGTMLVGDFKGEKVQEAKEKVRIALIGSGEAFPFADPSAEVISRSADECVVANIPQWFLNYGENDPEWQNRVLDYVKDKDGLETYTQETENSFVANLEWLNQWACARTYGLGSKLPWDPKFLVESLSDSTVYMSYYTVAHFLHSDRFGKSTGPMNIKPEQVTDEFWDYIFTRTSDAETVSKSSGIPVQDLHTLRRNFEYWYPLDMRSSGKDLIPNHLTFFLYIHLALFPREYWPKSIRANGHLLLNGEKMSKSTGNFLTLSQSVKKFGADATRITLADAGDGMEDANFEEKGANAAIMRMYTLKDWIEDTLVHGKSGELRETSGDVIWDTLFLDEMHALVHESHQHYTDTNYKLALKASLYDFQSARDFYREACLSSGHPMSRPLLLQYVELQSLVICTIAPHWAEHMWLEILHKPNSIQTALWPDVPTSNPQTTAMRTYVKTTASAITSAEAQASRKVAKGKAAVFDPRKPKRLTIFVARSFPQWQEKYVDLVRELFAKSNLSDDKNLNASVAKLAGKGPELKKAMPFVQSLKKDVGNADTPQTKEKVLGERKLGFDEEKILMEMRMGLMKTTGCEDVVVRGVGDGEQGLPGMAENAVPGMPTFLFENVS